MELTFRNATIKHWNPGCENPLIFPVHVTCNTPDEVLHRNIKTNSRRLLRWIKQEPAHDRTAILVGSGPSLKDSLDEIRGMDGEIFAMNGAAQFLADNGIMPDYQVMIDARDKTRTLVGPAKQHLFASQVSPLCFDMVDDPIVWHLQIEGIDDLLPAHNDEYCLLGGAASVGNTATCLVYAMGYRIMHCFGYDSSHSDGESHAFVQEINKGDPCAEVIWNEKRYVASFTMKLQAERFMETSRVLRHLGCDIHVHGTGLLPDIYNAPKLSEKEKYERVWAHDEYRKLAPGELLVNQFVEVAKPSGLVIDFGCGTGRAGLKMRELGLDVLLVDFVDNSRDPEAMALDFLPCDLTESPVGVFARYGYCTDMLEHIEPDKVRCVIGNIFENVSRCFFQISTVHDHFGNLVGDDLHLTVQPHEWWHQLFADMGLSVEWQERNSEDSLFFVTSIKE